MRALQGSEVPGGVHVQEAHHDRPQHGAGGISKQLWRPGARETTSYLQGNGGCYYYVNMFSRNESQLCVSRFVTKM